MKLGKKTDKIYKTKIFIYKINININKQLYIFTNIINLQIL